MTLVKRLYDLQQIDLDIQREQEALDEISRKLGESEDLLKARADFLAEQEHLAEMEKKQRDLEWEIEDLRKSIAQVNTKLYSGANKNPKELVSLEKEVEIFKAKLREKEDSLLDWMAETETIQDKMKLDGERLEKLEVVWREEQKALAQRQTEVEDRLSDLSQKRRSAALEINKQTLELYETIRLRKGQAVVKVAQGRCHGCHLNLSMKEWQRARAGDLAQCSSCGRILYLD